MTAVSHGTYAKRMAEVHAALRGGPCPLLEREPLRSRESVSAWKPREPGRRWPVKAASRRSRARAARALTGLRRSGMALAKRSWRRALVRWRRDGDLFEPCVACLHAMCAELCLFSRSSKMQAAVQSAPRDKSLIFRPSADNSSRRRLRLLSCRVRSVALRSVKCATRCDILRTMANR